MDILNPAAVIGTNAWGSKAYSRAMRGSYVPDDVLIDSMREAREQDIALFDMARDYGLGKAQKMLGSFGTDGIVISAKYTPFTHYKKGCVRKSLMKDLEDFGRDYVEVYWLHLPTDIEEHLEEISELVKEGKIKHVGVSNFTLDECIRSREILLRHDIPLYDVMIDIASRRGIKVPQVAMAYCACKGVIPMTGCRKPSQVKDLAEASRMTLTEEEIERLESASDKVSVKIMGADIFRHFVLKERKR